jgi:phosphoribosylanthranilate isomerase
MRVKICGIRNPQDIETAVAADADAVGFLVGQVHPSPDFILPSTAARLSKDLPPYICPVLVTHITDPETIQEMVLRSSIFTIQLHGGCTKEEVKELNRRLPSHTKLILSVHVSGGKTVPAELDDFYPMIDGVLLDCYNRDRKAVDSCGFKANWLLARDLIRQCPVPVILAGGLKSETVAEAIGIAKPYGVDANASLKSENGDRCPVKCRDFVHRAKAAAFSA